MSTAAHPSVERRYGIRDLARERSVQIGLAAWVAASLAIVPLSHGRLPFNRPALASVPFSGQLGVAALGPVYSLIFMGVIYWLTRRRSAPDIASRAPARAAAWHETLALWTYGACVLGLGQIVGRRLFGEGIGLHLNGSLFGVTRHQSTNEAWTWAAYNFIFYAAVPYFVFRSRGYTREALNLTSSDTRNDTLVIVVVLAMQSALDLAAGGLLKLSAHQMLMGGALSFLLHLLGTGLPVMIFIYAILMPRYARLSGSAAATVLLGAVSYAALHIFEYWTVYDSLSHAALSLLFVFLTFTTPGLVKSFLTVRTGNAWVHFWAYHAISPHVTADTPVVVKIFGIPPN